MDKILLDAAAKYRTLVRNFECCGSALISMRIRIQGAKPMRIHADPDPDTYPSQTLKSQKKKIYLSR